MIASLISTAPQVSRTASSRLPLLPKAALALAKVGELPVDPTLNPAELAAYTLVASTVLNMDETVTKR